MRKKGTRNGEIPSSDCGNLFAPEELEQPSDRLFFEKLAFESGYRQIAGVDEVGRGALAGPVVAAAVILPNYHEKIPEGIRDSKKLSSKQRSDLFEKITKSAVAVGIGIVDNRQIDGTSILKATLEAMKIAVNGLAVRPDYVLVDGNQKFMTEIPQKTIISGDDRSVSIGAASIVAKVIRDSMMDHFHLLHPNYSFDENKGYGTSTHLEALKEYGYTLIHRTTFKGVA